ncbi:MAG: ArnT family glycosyltransferase, partial [Planctomycetia bacterium]
PRFHGWLVLLAAASVLLVRLGGPALWDDDEPKNAACSLAMLDSGDWCVPAVNGRLRVEKPPLVNWLQVAGFAWFGRNETGARIGSALATVGTCILTWRTGAILFGPAAGLLGGIAMATCVWTAVGGRAATPDAPLVFLTTLSLYLYVRGTRGRAADAPPCDPGHADRSGRAPGSGLATGSGLAVGSALGIGAACGAAMLAKGPIGAILPVLALVCDAAWRSGPSVADRWAGVVRLRPVTILLAAAVVALPWYACVTLRTDGDWLRGFLLVHNVGRFAAPMEGHSGSWLYYPAVIAVGLFPWSIVLAAMLAHAAIILRDAGDDPRRAPLRLLACWAGVWMAVLSCAGTKLPGYIWPAYPALAMATGLFLADWARGAARFSWPRSSRAGDVRVESGVVMRLAWCILGATGPLLGLALAVGTRRIAPGNEWLGLLGLVPVVAAVAAWRSQTAGRPWRSLAAVAVGGCLLVTLAASVGAERISRAQGSRALVAALDRPAHAFRWACLWNVPPSLVFYTGERIERLSTPDEVAALLARHADARVVIDSRQHAVVAAVLPPGSGVLARVPTLTGREYLLLGAVASTPRPDDTNVAVTATDRDGWH